MLLSAQGRATEAVSMIDAELASLGPPTKVNERAVAAALRVAARVHALANDFEGSKALAQQAVELAQRLARDPTHSADVGESLLLLAQAQQHLGDRVACGPTARRATAALEYGLGTQHALTQAARGLCAQ
jgi:hypothetical protein